MVNLKAKPFYLNDQQINWVEETIASMSLEEKIGQLFIILNWGGFKENIKNMVDNYHISGLRWQGAKLEEVWEQNRYIQEISKVPVLIAANALNGGDGAVKEGTTVATPASCGASPTLETAYRAGKVAAKEAKAVGCTWTFAPCTDVLLNWRNTIVNDRAYGKDVDKIIGCAKEYIKAMHEEGIATCAKHFPGDGTEERDQHLVMGCNDLGEEEWENTFGKVYRAVIEADCDSFMIGHICCPSMQRKFNPTLEDKDIMPATMSKELLTDLLRGELGFNGVITTDASHMAGLSTMAPRSIQVPTCIAAGCDMFLYFNDPKEDYQYMMDGYKSGLISEERLSDALHRILGLKAKVCLDQFTLDKFPAKEGLSIVGCEKHHDEAYKCAQETITLVKDTQHVLPIDPAKKKRAILYYMQSEPVLMSDGPDKHRQIVIEELERAGFEVDVHKDFYDYVMEGDKMAPLSIMSTPPVEEFKQKYDVVFVFIHTKGYAKENVNRVVYSASHSSEIPWFVHEVPTIGVSLNYTNSLYDVPMLKTFINAYAPTREYVRATIEKIIGKQEFTGSYDDNVWCGRWDTKL